jgi:thioredoxin-like negative regulator of GroEL
MKPVTWTPSTPAITVAELPVVTGQHPVVVIHFWAVWDHHDRRMDAILKRERAGLRGRIAFFSLDIDQFTADNAGLVHELRVLNIPALACFIHGRHHATAIGLRPGHGIRETLQEWAQAGALPLGEG